MPKRAVIGLFLGLGVGFAQGPVILQRGVLNAVTLEPAPSRVAPGDILIVRGLNLGPVEGATASGTPLPTTLAGVQVLIATRPAPIFSVAADQVRVQVPIETPNGLVSVVVLRGELRSRPASVRVNATAVGPKTKNNLGFGEAGSVDGKRLTLSMTGLGLTEPLVGNGETGPAEGSAVPRRAIRAHVDGLPAEAKAALSPSRVGEFDVTIELPEGSQPGDIVSVSNGGAPLARSVLGSTSDAVVQYVKLPAALRNVTAIRQSDLRGSYLLANGPRGTDGCFPTWIFDMTRSVSTRVEPCLLAQQNAVTPVNSVNESHILASFTGPASDQQNLISSKIMLFNPAQPTPMTVDLPSPAAFLGAAGDGSLIALGGTANYTISPDSGEVRELTGGVGGPIPGGGGGGGAIIGAGGLQIDLGDGLNVPLSFPSAAGQGVTVLVVGNDANKPTRAKLALLGNNFSVTGTRDFPASWIPLLPPAQPPAPGAPGGGAGQGGFAALRLPAFFDAATRTYYVLAKMDDGSAQGFVAFSGAQLSSKEIPFPAGWYAATCSPTLQISTLELSRRIAVFGSKRVNTEVQAVCSSQGYLALDLTTQAFAAVPLPGVGEVNTRAASGDVNDYLFASNTDPQNATLSDTLYIFDSVAGSPFRLDLPPGIVGFQQVTPVAALNGLVATAIGTRVAGDGGLVFFDLENEKTTVFPVPEGFTTVNFVAVFPTTRKLIARGIKCNGAQYLIYDLTNGNLLMPPNPEGVAYAGPLPALPGGGPGPGGPGPGGPGFGGFGQQGQVQTQVVNSKASTIAALAYDASRNPVGIITIKVP